jgi:hypothetical protein
MDSHVDNIDIENAIIKGSEHQVLIEEPEHQVPIKTSEHQVLIEEPEHQVPSRQQLIEALSRTVPITPLLCEQLIKARLRQQLIKTLPRQPLIKAPQEIVVETTPGWSGFMKWIVVILVMSVLITPIIPVYVIPTILLSIGIHASRKTGDVYDIVWHGQGIFFMLTILSVLIIVILVDNEEVYLILCMYGTLLSDKCGA